MALSLSNRGDGRTARRIKGQAICIKKHRNGACPLGLCAAARGGAARGGAALQRTCHFSRCCRSFGLLTTHTQRVGPSWSHTQLASSRLRAYSFFLSPHTATHAALLGHTPP